MYCSACLWTQRLFRVVIVSLNSPRRFLALTFDHLIGKEKVFSYFSSSSPLSGVETRLVLLCLRERDLAVGLSDGSDGHPSSIHRRERKKRGGCTLLVRSLNCMCAVQQGRKLPTLLTKKRSSFPSKHTHTQSSILVYIFCGF